MKADCCFSAQPIPKLGRLSRGADEQRSVFALEKATSQNRWQIVMRKQQRYVQPRNKVKEENARNECVLGRDQIKDQRPCAGDSLPKAKPMLTKQFVLQEIIFRAVASERFEKHAEHEHAAVNAVTAPGQVRAGRIKGDQDPDSEPEERRNNGDLAEQE